MQRDKLLHLGHILEMNAHVIRSMQEGFKSLREDEDTTYGEESEFNKFETSLKDSLRRVEHHLKRVEGLTRRCESLAALVRK
jgi:hypothetical protein